MIQSNGNTTNLRRVLESSSDDDSFIQIEAEKFQYVTILVHASLLILEMISHCCLRKVKNSLCDKIIHDFIKTWVWLSFVVFAIFVSKHKVNFGFLNPCDFNTQDCPLFEISANPNDTNFSIEYRR